jgi:hypothetical protein
MATKKKTMFKVGQVVRIDADYYRRERRAEQYQRITRVFPWTTSVRGDFGNTVGNVQNGFGCCLLNGDECHEKYLKALTKKELGV